MTIITTDQNAAPGTPVTQKLRPPRTPWIAAMTSVPWIVARLIDMIRSLSCSCVSRASPVKRSSCRVIGVSICRKKNRE